MVHHTYKGSLRDGIGRRLQNTRARLRELEAKKLATSNENHARSLQDFVVAAKQASNVRKEASPSEGLKDLRLHARTENTENSRRHCLDRLIGDSRMRNIESVASRLCTQSGDLHVHVPILPCTDLSRDQLLKRQKS